MSKANGKLVSEQRNYNVLTVAQAKRIAKSWLREMDLENALL